MMLTEISREYAFRGLPVLASRNDLLCILETVIRAEGNNIHIYAITSIIVFLRKISLNFYFIHEIISNMEEHGLIDSSTSAWAVSIVLAKRKTEHSGFSLTISD